MFHLNLTSYKWDAMILILLPTKQQLLWFTSSLGELHVLVKSAMLKNTKEQKERGKKPSMRSCSQPLTL